MSENASGNPNRQRLFACLDKLAIVHHTEEHEAVFTVEESREIKSRMPGGHSKNLLLKDKKGAVSLVTAHSETKVDLVGLGKAIGAKGRLSFGKPELMREILGVEPGSVTPFSLINEGASALANVIFDEALMVADPVWFHPLENTASTAISAADLQKFAVHLGLAPKIMALADPKG